MKTKITGVGRDSLPDIKAHLSDAPLIQTAWHCYMVSGTEEEMQT
jgi:hypothetical protein